jgi:hypothetical protein
MHGRGRSPPRAAGGRLSLRPEAPSRSVKRRQGAQASGGGVIGRGPAARKVRSLRGPTGAVELAVGRFLRFCPPPGSPSSLAAAPTVALRLLGRLLLDTI